MRFPSEKWLQEQAVAETSRVWLEWFGARQGWTPEQHMAALVRELTCLHARATCRVLASVRRQFPGAYPALVDRLRVYGPAAAERGPVALPDPSAYVCRCRPGPHHVRGISRCEWNEVYGWRPLPVGVGR